MSKTNYNQDIIDQSLANTFDLENNQEEPKKNKHGGSRPGSGRKKGSLQKVSVVGLLAAIAKEDIPFEQGLAIDYARARASGDMHVIQKYQQMFLNKVVADKHETDITSNGQTIGASFQFPVIELNEWKDEQSTQH